MGGILVHSLSAYQSHEQANRPAGAEGAGCAACVLAKAAVGRCGARDRTARSAGTTSFAAWTVKPGATLRDILLQKKVITENDKGHYLLCRDLHTVPFWQLKEWVDKEHSLNEQDSTARQLTGKRDAYRLLLDQRKDQRNFLGANLVELFNQ